MRLAGNAPLLLRQHARRDAGRARAGLADLHVHADVGDGCVEKGEKVVELSPSSVEPSNLA